MAFRYTRGVKLHVKLSFCPNNLPGPLAPPLLTFLCFPLLTEVMELCSQLLIPWSNIDACWDRLCMAYPPMSWSTVNECQKIVFESKQTKDRRDAWEVFSLPHSSQTLLWSDCVMYFQLPFVFTISTCSSHLSFPLCICQNLKVNNSKISTGKGIKNQKNFLGGHRDKPIFHVYEWGGRGLWGGNRLNKGSPGALVCPFMLSAQGSEVGNRFWWNDFITAIKSPTSP